MNAKVIIGVKNGEVVDVEILLDKEEIEKLRKTFFETTIIKRTCQLVFQ